MEDIDGGLHPAVDGQSLDEDEAFTHAIWSTSMKILQTVTGVPNLNVNLNIKRMA